MHFVPVFSIALAVISNVVGASSATASASSKPLFANSKAHGPVGTASAVNSVSHATATSQDITSNNNNFNNANKTEEHAGPSDYTFTGIDATDTPNALAKTAAANINGLLGGILDGHTSSTGNAAASTVSPVETGSDQTSQALPSSTVSSTKSDDSSSPNPGGSSLESTLNILLGDSSSSGIQQDLKAIGGLLNPSPFSKIENTFKYLSAILAPPIDTKIRVLLNDASTASIGNLLGSANKLLNDKSTATISKNFGQGR